MRAQEQRHETGLGGVALAVLRAEMEALSLLMPGAFAPLPKVARQSEAEEAAEAEEMFENMPL